MDSDDIASIMSQAVGRFLSPDEGIIIHHKEKGYAVYRDSQSNEVRLTNETPDYLKAEHGTLIWIHYADSEAPDPKDGEIFIDDIKAH